MAKKSKSEQEFWDHMRWLDENLTGAVEDANSRLKSAIHSLYHMFEQKKKEAKAALSKKAAKAKKKPALKAKTKVKAKSKPKSKPKTKLKSQPKPKSKSKSKPKLTTAAVKTKKKK
jgi:hypothetical protein